MKIIDAIFITWALALIVYLPVIVILIINCMFDAAERRDQDQEHWRKR